ncbi:MAG: hypothetical protein LJE68_11750, partial [Rhodobacter sp.]|nr:hypothetical protein [Rhodobacter sp.]
RNEAHANLSKSVAGLVIYTTLLAFFDSLSGTTTFAGLTFSIPELGSLALCVLISIVFISFVLGMLEQLILDQFLYTLGERIGAHHFELVLLDFTAKNLWSSAITPKYFGIKSESGQHIAQRLLLAFFVLILIAFISYPVSIVGTNIYSALTRDPDIIHWILSGLAIVGFTFGFFLILAFSISYKFRPADLSEPSTPFVPEDLHDLGHPPIPSVNQEPTTQD